MEPITKQWCRDSGFGLWNWKAYDGEEVHQAVPTALEAGTPHWYCGCLVNEGSVGRAIKDSGILREELLLRPSSGMVIILMRRPAFARSLERFGAGLSGLRLTTGPIRKPLREQEAWRSAIGSLWAMEDLYREGKTTIGVNNFLPHHLEPAWDSVFCLRSIKFVWRLVPIRLKRWLLS